MNDIDKLQNLYENKNCDNCSKKIFCIKENYTCESWEKDLLIEDMLKIVRVGFPTMVKSDIVSEIPMTKNNLLSIPIKINYNYGENNETT